MATYENTNNQIHDPSFEGLEGLRGLLGLNSSPRLKYEGLGEDWEGALKLAELANESRDNFNTIADWKLKNAPPTGGEIYIDGYGESKYDKEITTLDELYNLNNTRGEKQSGAAQLGAGVTKGLVTVGTTVLNNTVGVVAGITSMIQGKPYWDNEVQKIVSGISDYMERELPNYYTDAELNRDWHENIFSANFIGDKVIKNLGYVTGAAISGKIATTVLTAVRLPALVGAITGSHNVARGVTSIISGAAMTAGETSDETYRGTSEYINNSKLVNDILGNIEYAKRSIFEEYQYNRRDKQLNININSETLGNQDQEPAPPDPNDPAYILYLQKLEIINNLEKEARAYIEDTRIKIGNSIFLTEYPIMMAQNLFFFKRLLSGGYSTSRTMNKIIGGTKEMLAGDLKAGTTIMHGVGGGIARIATEAGEEGFQDLVPNLYVEGYDTELANFYAKKIDPDAEQKTVDWIKSIANGVNKTVNSNSFYESMFLGGLTGGMGFISVGKSTNMASDMAVGKGRAVGIRGGLIGEIRNAMDERRREQEIINYINKRVKDPEFLNYYQGIIRHRAEQDKMDWAASMGKIREFKDAEFSQLVSDIIMFNNAGKLSNLVDMISSAFDVSDKSLESIVKNTTFTQVDSDGTTITTGPFIDTHGNPMYETEEGKKKMINTLTQSKDEILKTIEDYKKASVEIDMATNERFSDDALAELTWLKMQRNNWEARIKQMVEELHAPISTVLGRMAQIARHEHEVVVEEGMNNKGITEKYERASENERVLNYNMSIIRSLLNLKEAGFAIVLANNSKLVEDLKESLGDLNLGLSADEAANASIKIDDIIQLYKNMNLFNQKLHEYYDDPSKLMNSIAKTKKKTSDNLEAKNNRKFKDTLLNAKDLTEFRNAMDEESNEEVKSAVFEELEEEGNELAKEYKEINAYDRAVREALDEMGIKEEERALAEKLWRAHYDKSSTFKDIQDTESAVLNDSTSIYDESLSESINMFNYQKAKYDVVKAMKKVNMNERFRNNFSEPVDSPTPEDEINSTIDNDTTGNSEVSTTNSAISDAVTPELEEIPVEEANPEEVKEENDNLNSQSNSNSGNAQESRTNTANTEGEFTQPKYKFYRPSISEFPISPEGTPDFRKFVDSLDESNADTHRIKAIYKYLEDAGAFKFVNEGGLKEGDTIYFKIDNEFESRMQALAKEKGFEYSEPTIFMINKDRKIVGTVEASGAFKYEGLKELKSTILKKYAESKKNNPKRNMHTIMIPVKVSKIMVGQVPTSTEEKSLSELVKDGSPTPILGIVKNGTLDTNGALQNSEIVKPQDMKGKEGNVYVLIPNGARKYSPMRLRTRHFSQEEFDVDSVEVQNSPLFKALEETILGDDTTPGLATVQSEEDLISAISKLKDVLYKPKNIHINLITNRRGETNLVFEERELNDSGVEKKENGKYVLKSPKEFISLFTDTSEGRQFNSTEAIKTKIIKTLQSYKLPFQINAKELNIKGYNEKLIKSNILTSNITDLAMHNNWFITNYINNGIEEDAVPPVMLPPEQRPGHIDGTKINSLGLGIAVYVDLKSNTVVNERGEQLEVNADIKQLLLDLAWCVNNASKAQKIGDVIKLPYSNRWLNVKTQTYVDPPAEGSNPVTDSSRPNSTQSNPAQKTIDTIQENQKRVNKKTTDEEHYYILEEDGQYHQYKRVHSILEDNEFLTTEEKKEYESVKSEIKEAVRKHEEDKKSFDILLSKLQKKYNIEIRDIGLSPTISNETVNKVLTRIKDSITGLNSERALNAGSAVDTIVRDFFTVGKTEKPINMSDSAYSDLIKSLNIISEQLKRDGIKFYTNNIVLFHKFADGTRIAGEVDILAVNKNGNFMIYDVKTQSSSFIDHSDINFFDYTINGNPSTQEEIQDAVNVKYTKPFKVRSKVSNKVQYRRQLSAYKALFEAQYHGIEIKNLGILPFRLSYTPNSNEISRIFKETGIKVEYSLEGVNMPKQESTNSVANRVKSIFDESLNDIQHVDHLSEEERALPDSKIGFYESIMERGVLHKGLLTYIGKIGEVKAYATKVQEADTNSKQFYVVFENGMALPIYRETVTKADEEALNEIHELISIKAALKYSNEPTILNNSTNTSTDSTTSNNVQGNATAAKSTIEEAVGKGKRKFNPNNRKKFSKVNGFTQKIWNQEKELKWLEKVLPQLTREQRVKVIKGLIKAGSNGEVAWGMFHKGVITLSDIAAAGTTYHEAFHLVFNTLLDSQEQQDLFIEAREMYDPEGKMDIVELEEAMAEGFREYVMTRERKGLLNKIKVFFQDLYNLITGYKKMYPHLTSLYQRINDGKYAERNLNKSNETKYSEEEYTQEMKDIIAKAKADGTFMKAPNGKPTNLTVRQWVHVRTKAFKKWFGDWENDPENASKIVDENGEPLVVYHGTNDEFYIFDTKRDAKNGQMLGKGSYFIPDFEKANSYGNVMSVFLNIKNPYDENIDLVSYYVEPHERHTELPKRGFDGVYWKGKKSTIYVALEPNQIKSATDNVGTFSTENDDIRYRKIEDIITPIKEQYKGKLIYAAPGTGKSTIADNKEVFDSDYLLGQLLGVNSAQAGNAFRILSFDEKQEIAKKYDNLIKEKLAQGKTVITARLLSIKDADVIVYNSTPELANERITNNLRENPFSNDEYTNETFKTIEESKKTSNAEYIVLNKDEYLGTKILSNPKFNIREEIVKTFPNVKEVMTSFLQDFGIKFEEFEKQGYTIDYINKVIKSIDNNSLIKGGGEMIAYMMQYNGIEKQIIVDLAIKDGIITEDDIYINGNIKTAVYKKLDKSKYFKIIGESIATELENQFNSVKAGKGFREAASKSLLFKIRNIIKKFIDNIIKHTNSIQRLADYSIYVSSNVLYGNTFLIKKSILKPGDEKKGAVQQVKPDKAFDENPYELDIVKKVSNLGFTLTGSIALAAQGTIFRPAENLLHDLDFNAGDLTKSELEKKLRTQFPNLKFVREINNENYSTETYITMSEPFIIEKPVEGVSIYSIRSKKTGKIIASFVNSDLTILEEGVTGKFLDFFIGEKEENFDYNYKGTIIKMALDSKIFGAKLEYSRLKDIFDYNRYVRYNRQNNNYLSYDKLSNEQQERLKETKDVKSIQLFESLNEQTKGDLKAKGWSEQEFNSLSEREKQQAIKCS